jgi:hypothetical protein
MIVMDIFYGNNQRVPQWLLEPGARAFLASAQQAGWRLFNMSLRMYSSVTSPRDNLEWIPVMVDMVLLIIWLALRCFNEELSLLPKNPTEAKLQAMSTRVESTEPT